MDSDLQHVPEGIPQLLVPWERDGCAIVYARRVGLDRGGLTRKLLTKTFYRVFDFMSEVKIDRETGDFLLLDRRVVDAFLAMPSATGSIAGSCPWAGFRTTTIPLATEARHAGTTSFGFLKLVNLAVTAITAFGTPAAQDLDLYRHGVLARRAVCSARSSRSGRSCSEPTCRGYPSIIVAVLVSAGIQLIGLGIIGEYLGHVYSEVKRASTLSRSGNCRACRFSA